MAIKPVKPNETGGKMSSTSATKPVNIAMNPRVPPMTEGGPRRPLIKANVRNAPLGGGGKIKAIKANGGLGGGNNLTPAGKFVAKRNPNNNPRRR